MASPSTSRLSARGGLPSSRPAGDGDAASIVVAGGGAVGAAVRQAFADDPKLEDAFAAAHAEGMRRRAAPSDGEQDGAPPGDAGPANRRVAHDALAETILAYRTSFPPPGFTLHTELGGGISVSTAIPPAAALRTREEAVAPSVAAPPSPERLAAQSRIASAAVAAGETDRETLIASDPGRPDRRAADQARRRSAARKESEA